MNKLDVIHYEVTPDIAAKIRLQNRALMEKREVARRDVAKIIVLWQTKQWQAKHTDEPESIA